MRKMATAYLVGIGSFFLTAAIAAKEGVEYLSMAQADRLISEIGGTDKEPLELAKEITKKVHKHFGDSDTPLPYRVLYNFRPYLTNDALPHLVQIDSGAIDLLAARGQCDNYARALAFVLKRAGFSAWQFNIMGKTTGHAITLAQDAQGTYYLLDPLYNLAAIKQDRPISPEELFSFTDTPSTEIWKSLGDTKAPDLYDQLKGATAAKQGDRLDIHDEVTLAPLTSIIIGSIDGMGETGDPAVQYGFFPVWNYIGRRYDRGWRRSMSFGQDTLVTIALVDQLDSRFLTSNKQPVIEGNKLIYAMKAGETLTFDSALAQRNWMTMRSYQDIDYIKLENVPK